MISNNTMDIIAYYLSEYDMTAFTYLGYKSQASGFREIASVFGRKDGYLRRLRDEYDVVTSNHRNGQRNRPPRQRIMDTKEYLSSYSFDELSSIVKSIITNATSATLTPSSIEDVSKISEIDLERIINAKDMNSRIEYKTSSMKAVRIYDHSIIYGLKALYKGRCQLCGYFPLDEFITDITEAHHIEYYSETQNNDASNILILCPNHHSIIHKLNPTFDRKQMRYLFPNGIILGLKLNYHINEVNNNDRS
ncbi:HNH endonuclease signature motif containing protein [Ruminococcus flavefaciens]|uniref:HNH endonuclease signature motif containing protein n=1 Tax=Ruminococcus flavefaciens TaxID=1265 RepID=UPI0002DBE4DF|nr:HNH endonuclease signature motif containing protein [Ruminococcus flavefaciens]